MSWRNPSLAVKRVKVNWGRGRAEFSPGTAWGSPHGAKTVPSPVKALTGRKHGQKPLCVCLCESWGQAGRCLRLVTAPTRTNSEQWDVRLCEEKGVKECHDQGLLLQTQAGKRARWPNPSSGPNAAALCAVSLRQRPDRALRHPNGEHSSLLSKHNVWFTHLSWL